MGSESREEILEEISFKCDHIREDHISGANIVAEKAAEVLLYLSETLDDIKERKERSDLISETCRLLMNAQPEMAPIKKLSNLVLKSDENLPSTKKQSTMVRGIVQDFLKKMKRSNKLISRSVLDLIEDGFTVFTHSHSSTVRESILNAWRSGKQFSVICTESRPMYEGIEMSRMLANEGINITLIADSASFHFIDRSDIVLLGADSIIRNSLRNKIGTSGIAHYCRNKNIPCYSLCSTQKILPRGRMLSDEARKDPREISRIRSTNITVENIYFDVTNVRIFKGIVTEDGIKNYPDFRASYLMNK